MPPSVVHMSCLIVLNVDIFYFQFDKELHFLDQFSFSVEGNLDPDGLMPPGDNYAVSPIQLSYSPVSMSAVYGAPLVPVSLKFKSPGKGENGLQNLYIELISRRELKEVLSLVKLLSCYRKGILNPFTA